MTANRLLGVVLPKFYQDLKKQKKNLHIIKNDARKVDSKTLQYLRDRAIKLRESGVSNIETASILGLSKITTSRWYSKYKKDGEKAKNSKSDN